MKFYIGNLRTMKLTLFSFLFLIQLINAQQEVHIDNKFNFKVTRDAETTKIQAKNKFNKNYFTLRHKQNFYMNLNCVIEGVNGDLKFNKYVKKNIQLLKKDGIKTDEASKKKITLNEFKGISYRATSSEFPETDNRLFFLNLNGIYYRIEFVALKGKDKELQTFIDVSLKDFKPVNNKKKFYNPDKPAPFESETHKSGFYTKTLDLGWTRWDAGESFSGADAAAEDKEEDVYLIYSFSLEGLKPESRAILKAMLSTDGANLDDEGLGKISTVKNKDHEKITTSHTDEDLHVIYEIRAYKNKAVVQVFRCASLDRKDAVRKAARIFQDLEVKPESDVKCGRHHSSIINQMGLYYHNLGKDERSFQFFDRARRLNTEDKVFAANTLYALSQLNEYDKMMKIINETKDKNNDILHWEGWTLKRLNKKNEAEKVYAELLEDEYADDDFYDDYIHLLLSRAKFKEAEKLIKSYSSEDESYSKEVIAAQYASDFEHYDFAGKMLEDVNLTDNAGAAKLKIEILIDQDKYQDAVNTAIELEKKGQKALSVQAAKATAQIMMRNFTAARETIKTIRSRNRNYRISSLLSDLNYYEGNHSNSLPKLNISPAAVPEVIAKLQREVKVPENINSDRFINWHITSNQIVDKKFKKTLYLKISLLDSSAIDDFTTLYHSTSPRSSISVNKLQISYPDGSSIDVPQQKFYTTSETNGVVLSESKKLHMPVPGLQKKCTIELILTETFPYTYTKVPYAHLKFGNYSSTGLKAHTYTGDVDDINYKVFGDVKLHRKDGLFAAFKTKMGSIEGLQYPLPSENIPKVFLTASGLDWKKETLEYYDDIKHTLLPDPEVNALAEKVFKNAATKEDKIKAAISYISKNYIYKALEFGSHNIIPSLSSHVKDCLYGDCKDLSILLCQLLRTQHIEADPVLISTDFDLIKELPTLDQFNHMIALIDGAYFIDSTARSLDIHNNIPLSIAGRTALVVSAKGPVFKKLPEAKQARNVSVEGEIILEEQGVRLKDKVIFNNYLASSMREWWRDLSEKEMEQAMINIVASISQSPQINNFKITGLRDSDQPLILNIDYTLKDSLLSRGNSLYRVPELWTSYFISIRQEKNRQHSFRTHTPLDMIIERAGKGKILNTSEWQEKSNVSDVTLKNSKDEKGIIQSIHYKRKRGLWQAGEFKAYNDINIKTVSHSQLILTK